MSELTLQPCPFCKSTHCEVLAVEIDLYAGMCRACGAHGPVRVLGPMQLPECVKAMAAHDWNQAQRETSFADLLFRRWNELNKAAIHSDELRGSNTDQVITDEYTEDPAAASPVEGQGRNEKPGEAVSTAAPGTLNSPEGASVEQRSNKAAGEPHVDRKPDGGGATVGQLSSAQLDLGDRLARFLDDIGMTAQAAADKGMDFGVHVATVYNVLKGKRVSQKTMDALAKALTRMERGRKLSGAANQQSTGTKAVQTAAEYDESLIQKLPTKFVESNSINRAPPPVAPPRHSRTP